MIKISTKIRKLERKNGLSKEMFLMVIIIEFKKL